MQGPFTMRHVTTPRRSTIATYEAGSGATHILVVGGFTARPVCEGALADALAKAVARGARCTMVDLASCGNSKYSGVLTMDTWFDDLAFIAEPRSDEKTLFVGASMGAWTMLALHERKRLPVGAMCALAPAIDWDTQYVLPGIERGRFTRGELFVMSPQGALLPNSLLDSMGKYHLLGRTYESKAPVHVIHGERDELASYDAAREVSRHVAGAESTFESLPGQDHGVAKLTTVPARLAFERWLFAKMP